MVIETRGGMTGRKIIELPTRTYLDEKINLHPITLSFQGTQSHLEKAYCQSVRENFKYMTEIRAVIFMAGVVYSVFGILDFLLVPQGYKSLFVIRFGIFLPYILFVLLFSYTRYFKKVMQLILVLTAFMGGGGIIAMIVISPTPATYSYYAGLILVFMFLYTFGRVRFIWATLSGWMLVLVYEISAISLTVTPLPVLINNNFFFICANLIGMASCYLLELFDRKNFYMTIQLETEYENTNKTNKELEQAKEIADASVRSKSEFLANMSHEIRTPMNAIIGMSDLAMNAGISQAQRNDYLDIIRTSARSLLGIINDILDVSKIESGRFELEVITFNIRDHVERIADMFTDIIHSKNLEFFVDIASDVPVFVRGDALRLQQVLLNLIGNAMKFTDHGEICVKLNKGRMTPAHVELLFEVTDTGIGIDLEKNIDLFNAFAQADGSITRKYGGTGLGLTICKSIVDMMGGAIHVDSQPGYGSRFCFHVMLEREYNENERRTSVYPHIQDLAALCVISNPSLQHVVCQMMDFFGIKQESFDQVKRALDVLKQGHRPMSNIMIIDDDALDSDTLNHIYRFKHTSPSNVPLSVILIGSLKSEMEIEHLKQSGIDEIVIKPVKSSSLIDSIMTIIHGEPVNRPMVENEYMNTGALNGMNILLVEDNRINQMVAIEILLLEGIHVDLASNGLEAIDMVREHTFDAVLMDVQMPEMDGIEATRFIRHDLGFKPEDLPVIAMTAHVLQDDKRRCLEAGMNDFISKPIDRHTVYNVLCKFYHSDHVTGLESEINHGALSDSSGIPEPLPGLDISDGIQRLGCDVGLYIDIVSSFIAYLQKNIEQLKHFADIKDLSGIKVEAHSIRGSAANISAYRLEKAAKKFENLTDLELPDKIKYFIEDLESAYQEFFESYTRLTKQADLIQKKKSIPA